MQEIVTTEAAALVLWPPDLKNWLTGKDADVGKDWRQKEKGTAENKIVRWHHQLNRQEFEQTLGDSEGQRIVRWHHQLNRHEFEQTLGDSEGQRIVRWHHQLNRQKSEQTLGDSEGQRIVRWHHQLNDRIWANTGR